MFFDKEFHFDHPDDISQHTARLIGSAGVLLLWGNAEVDWCAQQFEAVARNARAKGLCVFDPKETKSTVLEQIRKKRAMSVLPSSSGSLSGRGWSSFSI